MMVNGWIVFHFLFEEDRKVIEGKFSVLGMGSLVFSRWHVGFDPRNEKLSRRHL